MIRIEGRRMAREMLPHGGIMAISQRWATLREMRWQAEQQLFAHAQHNIQWHQMKIPSTLKPIAIIDLALSNENGARNRVDWRFSSPITAMLTCCAERLTAGETRIFL